MTRESSRLFDVSPSTGVEPFEEVDLAAHTNFQSRAPRSGFDFKEIALQFLRDAGGLIVRVGFEIHDLPVDAEVLGANSQSLLVLARGTPDEQERSGLRRTDTLEKVGFMAMQLARYQALPIVIVTSDLPERNSKPGKYLAKLDVDVWDVVATRGDLRGFQRLRHTLKDPALDERPRAPWRGPIRDSQPTLFDQTRTRPSMTDYQGDEAPRQA